MKRTGILLAALFVALAFAYPQEISVTSPQLKSSWCKEKPLIVKWTAVGDWRALKEERGVKNVRIELFRPESRPLSLSGRPITDRFPGRSRMTFRRATIASGSAR